MADVPPPPPPPENPYGNNNGDSFTEITDEGGLGQSTPSVAAKPGRVFLVIAVVGITVLFLVYMIFSGKKAPESKGPKPRTIVSSNNVQPPPLPPTTTLPNVAPPNIAPPTIPQPAKIEGVIKPQDDAAAKAQELARMRSRLMVTDGAGSSGLGSSLGGSDKPSTPTDVNSQFEANVIKGNTKAEKVEATHIGDLRRTIAQGRIIEATTESVINTDLPAPIRAIVSRDTYAEAGNVPLIPKGSRLIGQYNTAISGGQTRVFVVWTRIIRPDGVDVMINSPLVDQIGQAGIGGQVDTKFQQMFSRAIMASVVTIAFAIGQDKISGGETTTSNTAAGTSTTGDSASTATINALNRLGSSTDSFLKKFIDVEPTILVDQGTKVNVFINRDVIFPADIAGTRIVN